MNCNIEMLVIIHNVFDVRCWFSFNFIFSYRFDVKMKLHGDSFPRSIITHSSTFFSEKVEHYNCYCVIMIDVFDHGNKTKTEIKKIEQTDEWVSEMVKGR